MTDPQWTYPWPPNEHCWWHHAHEPIPESGACQVCFECGHVYLTREDLVEAFLVGAPSNYGETKPPEPPEHIPFCPLCIHDF